MKDLTEARPSIKDESDVERLLGDRRTPGALLDELARDPRWTRSPEIRRRLVFHPQMPLASAKRLVPHLYWRQLADLVALATLHPVLRRRAGKALEDRLGEMALGEKVAFARRAAGSLIDGLVRSSEPGVLLALLGNERLMEHDATRIASGSSTPAGVLEALGRHPRWGVRRSVRLALVANPGTPISVALQVLQGFVSCDLRLMMGDEKVPKIVRVGAKRLLEEGSALDSEPSRVAEDA